MCGKSIKAYIQSTHIRITHATERLEYPHKGGNSRCNTVFKHQVDLQSHLEKVHCNINVICTECGKIVKKSSMKDHKVQFTPTEEQRLVKKEEKKTINCPDDGCKSMFRTKQALLTHYKHQHTDEREQCTICGEWLKNLDGHMRTKHKTGNQFPCDEVNKI